MMDRAGSGEYFFLHVQGDLAHYMYCNDSIAKTAFKALSGRGEGPLLWVVSFSGGYIVAWHLHHPIQLMTASNIVSSTCVACADDSAAARGLHDRPSWPRGIFYLDRIYSLEEARCSYKTPPYYHKNTLSFP